MKPQIPTLLLAATGRVVNARGATLADCSLVKAAFNSVLYTTDASTSGVANGAIPGVLSTIGGDPKAGFPLRDQYVKDSSSLGPFLDGEFYSRYFTNWGPGSGFTTY